MPRSIGAACKVVARCLGLPGNELRVRRDRKINSRPLASGERGRQCARGSTWANMIARSGIARWGIAPLASTRLADWGPTVPCLRALGGRAKRRRIGASLPVCARATNRKWKRRRQTIFASTLIRLLAHCSPIVATQTGAKLGCVAANCSPLFFFSRSSSSLGTGPSLHQSPAVHWLHCGTLVHRVSARHRAWCFRCSCMATWLAPLQRNGEKCSL